MIDDNLVREQALLNFENKDFTQSPGWLFLSRQP